VEGSAPHPSLEGRSERREAYSVSSFRCSKMIRFFQNILSYVYVVNPIVVVDVVAVVAFDVADVVAAIAALVALVVVAVGVVDDELVPVPRPPLIAHRSSLTKLELRVERYPPSKPVAIALLVGSCACCRILAFVHSPWLLMPWTKH